MLFSQWGYRRCNDGMREHGWENVAIFATGSVPMHVALQLPSGLWTSKLGGGDDDIEQILGAVCGPLYGTPVRFLRRRRR
jgi:hypothetical protein